jgi:hypothetical protein
MKLRRRLGNCATRDVDGIAIPLSAGGHVDFQQHLHPHHETQAMILQSQYLQPGRSETKGTSSDIRECMPMRGLERSRIGPEVGQDSNISTHHREIGKINS